MTAVLFKGTRSLGTGFAIANVKMETHRCGSCGVIFAIEIEYMNERREDHKGWLCPNGHSFAFKGLSETEKLRQQLEREAARSGRLAAERDQMEASLRATKGVVTKMKKRGKAGVCPADGCHRHFADLERHVASKHPDLVEGVVVAEVEA